MDAMDAIEILKAEHRAVKGSMAEIVRGVDGNRKNLFAAFKRELELHDAIEREVFYPMIATNPKTYGFQGMDTETRRAVTKALRKLEALPVDSTDWFPYFKAIQGILGRQMDTEEFSVFERVRETLGPDELDELGRRMVYERHQRISAAVRPSLGRADSSPPRLPSRSMGAASKGQTDGGSTTF
jgi:hypothetical protein